MTQQLKTLFGHAVCFPAPTSTNSYPRETLAPWDLMPSSDCYGNSFMLKLLPNYK